MADDASLMGQPDIDPRLQRAQDEPAPADTATPVETVEVPESANNGADSGPQDDIQYLLEQAEKAIAADDKPTEPVERLTPFSFSDFTVTPAAEDKATLDLLRDVELDVKIELGRTHMLLEDVLKLRQGAVVALDKLAGDPVDVFVNGRLVARGEVLVLNDNFCVRVSELIAGDGFE